MQFFDNPGMMGPSVSAKDKTFCEKVVEKAEVRIGDCRLRLNCDIERVIVFECPTPKDIIPDINETAQEENVKVEIRERHEPEPAPERDIKHVIVHIHRPVNLIYYGSLDWNQVGEFRFVNWQDQLWTAQIWGNRFNIIKFGTLNWIPLQNVIATKRIVKDGDNFEEQNVFLEIINGKRFNYIVDGTPIWHPTSTFTFKSWDFAWLRSQPTTLHLSTATIELAK